MSNLKKLSTGLLCAVLFLMGLALSACGQAKIESISVILSSIKREYTLNEEVDFSTIKVLVKYDNNDTKEVGYEDVTLSEVKTDSYGPKTLIVTYEEKTTQVSIIVFASESDAAEIIGFEEPAFVVKYKDNIKIQTNKDLEYKNLEDVKYYVGDDNPFKFLPKITAFDEELGEPVTLKKYTSISTIKILKDDDTFEVLSGSELTDMVAIDEINSTYDFTEAAIGKTFKLSVVPYYYEVDKAIEFEFTVIDGWNAYTAVDLSKLDNNSIYEYDTANGTITVSNPWAHYKEVNNVTSEAISGLILHNDIEITANDIPDYYIYTERDYENDSSLPEGLLGSLKDWTSIYSLHTPLNTQFNFIGNFFTIDANELPKVKKIKDKTGSIITDANPVNSHSTLFGFGGDDDTVENQEMKGKIHVKNVSLKGNAQKSENGSNAGGIVFFRTTSQEFKLENTIASQVLTIAVPFGVWDSETKEPLNNAIIKDCKFRDSFSCMFFCWGATIEFINSEFKDAGGPILILSHVDNDDHLDYRYSTAKIDDNTSLTSWVNAEDAWFVMNSATTAANDISAILELLSQEAVDHGVENFPIRNAEGNFNFISMIMAETSPFQIHPINGSIETQYFTVDMNNPYYKAMYSSGAPILVGSNGGACYFGEEGFVGLNELFIKEGFFESEQIALYQGNMVILLELGW